MGTKEQPGAFDCYANAQPDEPMFVLLGRDKHAPALVWLWASLREIDQEHPAKVQEARECAIAMGAYRTGPLGKDGPAGFGVALLACAIDLVRVANQAAARDGALQQPSTIETFRTWMALTKVEEL